MTEPTPDGLKEAAIIRAFARIHLPRIAVESSRLAGHLLRARDMFEAKREAQVPPCKSLLDRLYLLDFYLAMACLEGGQNAWEDLFKSRGGRQDQLLIDALRQKAVRLYPRDEPRQEEAVCEFWGFLLAGAKDDSIPVLQRYDGRRPLAPWLIRVFHNLHLSRMRGSRHEKALPEDEPDQSYWQSPDASEERWHQEFRLAAQEWLGELEEQGLLLLGLRFRYRLSQRETASFLGIHESNVSRLTDKVRSRCLDFIEGRLTSLGWNGNGLADFVQTEMESLVLDDPRLGSENLAALLARKGLKTPLPDGD